VNARIEISDIQSISVVSLGDRYRIGIESVDEPGDPWERCSGAWISLSAPQVDKLCTALYDALDEAAVSPKTGNE
jgi:hypothetical protein